MLYFAQEVTSRMLADEMAAQEEGQKEADEVATQQNIAEIRQMVCEYEEDNAIE